MRIPPAWTSLTSLDCREARCDALATTASSTLALSTTDFATRWTSVDLHATATSLACSSFEHCVAVGRSGSRAWMARISGDHVQTLSMRYVPTALLSAACDHSACVALGLSTIVKLASPTS
jgi:hypothetical protein